MNIFNYVLYAFLLVGGLANAQTTEVSPLSSEILGQLSARIIPSADCDKNACVALDKISVSKKEKDIFSLEMTWNARKAVATSFPWSDEAMKFASMELNGKPYYAAMRSPEGEYLVALPAGKSVLRLNFSLVKPEITLPLAQIPGEYRDTEQAAFSVQGNRLFLKLHTDIVQVDKSNETEKQAKERAEFLPTTLPWVQLDRDLRLTREGWIVVSKVTMRGQMRRPVSIEVPLLEEEVVTETSFKIEGDKEKRLIVDLSANETIVWNSRIKEHGILKLESKGAFVQSWWVASDGFYSFQTKGIPMAARKTQGLLWEGYRPGIGEILEINSTLLSYEKGVDKAVFSSTVRIGVNKSGRQLWWTARLLSTVGGKGVIVMPEGYTYDSMTVNQVNISPQVADQKISAEFSAGESNLIVKLKSVESPWFYPVVAPYFEGATHANERIEWGTTALAGDGQLPYSLGDRWVIGVGGAQIHASIWWWAVVVSFIVLSWGVTFIPFVPLRRRDWFFLSIGLSTIAWTGIWWVVAWFVAMGWRKSYATKLNALWLSWGWTKIFQLCLLVLSFIFVSTIVSAAYMGLMHSPDLLSSSGRYSLNWYSSEPGVGGTPWVFSTPIWFYRVLMGAWAFWLAWKMLDWLKWGWECYATGGYWPPPGPKKEKKLKAKPESESPEVTPPADPTKPPTGEA